MAALGITLIVLVPVLLMGCCPLLAQKSRGFAGYSNSSSIFTRAANPAVARTEDRCRRTDSTLSEIATSFAAIEFEFEDEFEYDLE
jgi:hypothetical protein